MLVFRDTRRTVSAARLVNALLLDLREIFSSQAGDKLLNLLECAVLRAGELECGLHDAYSGVASPNGNASTEITSLSSAIADLLAQALLTPAQSRSLAAKAEQLCERLRLPATLDLSPPEGFCFYALHPLDYADLTLQPGLNLALKDRPVAVVGIRTIGTTLSAVVMAALQNDHAHTGTVGRITVRPGGHPYDRKTILNAYALAFVKDNLAKGAVFLVVDEGPGLSGSSFLSVAEALSDVGVTPKTIKFLCSHEVNPESLVAPEAATRWRKYQSFAVGPSKHLPATSADLLPEADWRARLFHHSAYDSSPYRHPDSWPAVWTGVTPRKLFTADTKTIFKYEGLGHFGAVVRSRASAVAQAGFGPQLLSESHGFTGYPVLSGKLLSPSDLSERLLDRMAHYLAFRAVEFRAEIPDQPALEEMARFNFAQITGRELPAAFTLELRRPVITDARMMPYEWICVDDGCILKLDAAAHGDNHFFPGPTDIAWDLAGAIVEWQLDPTSTEHFLRDYEKLSGDDARSRLPNYLVAYAAFQAGYAKMAASATTEDVEKSRLLRDYARYKLLLEHAATRNQACAV